MTSIYYASKNVTLKSLFGVIFSGTWLLLCTVSASAAEENSAQVSQLKSPEARRMLENLEEQLNSAFLAIAEEERKAGSDLRSFNYSVQIPEKKQYIMGMVVDTRELQKGLRVVSVEPGSAADKVGLKLNDYIVEVDEVRITDAIEPEGLPYLLKPRVDDTLLLRVKSGNQYREVSMHIPGLYVPEVNLQVAVKQDKIVQEQATEAQCAILKFGSRSVALKMGSVALTEINDEKIPEIKNFALKTIPVPVGQHRIKVGRSKWPDGNAEGTIRTLDIEVKANTKYYIGSKNFYFNEWIPVVYKEEQAECTLD